MKFETAISSVLVLVAGWKCIGLSLTWLSTPSDLYVILGLLLLICTVYFLWFATIRIVKYEINQHKKKKEIYLLNSVPASKIVVGTIDNTINASTGINGASHYPDEILKPHEFTD